VAATLSGAIKAHIEGQGLGVPAFRDEVPRGQNYPYVVVREGIALTQEPAANAFSGDHAVIELVQIDIWMQKRSPHSQAVTEDYELPDALTRAVNGVSLAQAPTKVYGMKVVGRTRFPDHQTRKVGESRSTPSTPSGLVRYSITVEVKRNL
jgi:hypothetical protein